MTTINRKETLAALEIVKPALGSDGEKKIPEHAHVWFDGEYAYAHNGGIGIRTKLEMPLDCGLPGTLLMGLLAKTGAETIEFELSDDNLIFKAGKSKIKLATLPLERFLWKYPETPVVKPLATIKTTKKFLAALKYALVLHPDNKKRMECHAVCMFAFDKEMDLYTTDYSSLLVAPLAEPIVGTAKKLALPRMLAEQIVAKCTPDAKLQMYADHFRIDTSDRTTMYSNVFDTTDMMDLPKFADKFIDNKANPPFKLPEGFSAALERAVLLSGSEPATVKLVVSGKALKLTARYKLGQLDEDFTLTKAIPKATIEVDAPTILSIKNVTELAVADAVVNLFGGDDFTYILAGKAGVVKTTKRSKADEEPAEEEA